LARVRPTLRDLRLDDVLRRHAAVRSPPVDAVRTLLRTALLALAGCDLGRKPVAFADAVAVMGCP
jgi:hypothetical protein